MKTSIFWLLLFLSSGLAQAASPSFGPGGVWTSGTFATPTITSGTATGGLIVDGISSLTNTWSIDELGDITGKSVRGTGDSTLTSGVGAELIYVGGTAYFIGYDRDTSAFIPVRLWGSDVTLFAEGGSANLTVTTTGVGLGTTTPSQLFTIQAAGGGSPLFAYNQKSDGSTQAYSGMVDNEDSPPVSGGLIGDLFFRSESHRILFTGAGESAPQLIVNGAAAAVEVTGSIKTDTGIIFPAGGTITIDSTVYYPHDTAGVLSWTTTP